MREWTDLDYAQAAIDMLPGSVEEIVEFLKREGITGYKWSGTHCPIAHWIQKWTGREDSYVGRFNAYPCGYPFGPDISVPAPVTRFVDAFDAGRVSL